MFYVFSHIRNGIYPPLAAETTPATSFIFEHLQETDLGRNNISVYLQSRGICNAMALFLSSLDR